MNAVRTAKPQPAEFLRSLGESRQVIEMYASAYKDGMSLSAWLDREFPAPEYNDGLDGYERLLKLAGIRTRSNPRKGYYASLFRDWDDHPTARGLFPEFCARKWREVAFPEQRQLLLAQDSIVGGIDNAYRDAMEGRWSKQIQPAIPLSEIVGLTTPIDSDAYRAFYLTNTQAQLRKVRVGEGAEVPRMKLASADRPIRLHKYGRILEASYEQLRRARIDRVTMIVQQMAVQAEVDKVGSALHVAVNGDGNSGTSPTTHNLTTLDTDATAGTLTLKGWLGFKVKFQNPYMCLAIFVQEAVALALWLLDTGTANNPLGFIRGDIGVGGFVTINPGMPQNVRMGITSDAPSLQVVGIDTRFALEHVTEIGSDISEIERFTTRQTQTLTMTEVDGFASLDNGNATIILDVNA